MTSLNLERIFNQIDALTVGYGTGLRDFVSSATIINYPPHNIVKVSDTVYVAELAVAGFKKSEIKIEEKNGMLTVTGKKDDTSTNQYQCKGIASRSFSKTFKLAEYFEVTNAHLEDGILYIECTKNVPPEAMPKVIEIN